ncbi:MAG TPA: PAS domain-containing protein [Chitinispirillaceae bacterium]|nr:PAS domain-containing protein [Chitinispirillaceae bacterium]
MKPHPLLRRFAWVPIPLLLTAITVAFYFSPGKSYENTAILLIMNFVCSFCISLLIIYFLSRIFLVQGSPGVFLLASGVLAWGFAGFAGVIAGITGESVSGFANISITIHNSSVLISALLQLTGTILLIRPVNISLNRSITLAFAFFAVLLFSGIITISTYKGWIPPFLIPQSGATPLRQSVLCLSIVLFFITSVLIWRNRRKSHSFMYWYVLALLFMEVGLFGVMIESVHGGVVSWLGRSAQFLSGPYMLAAVLQFFRESRSKGISLEDALIGWELSEEALRKSDDTFRFLFTNTSSGIAFHEIITDKQGNAFDYRFLDVNQSFELMTGLKASALIGKTVREVLPGIENDPVDWIGKYGRVALLGEQVCFEEFSQVFKKWYHVTAFQITPGRFGTIFDDITVRKENEQLLAFDLEAMTRLQKLGALSIHAGNQDSLLSEILDTAIAISGADFGNIQMTNSSGDLLIVAQRGFPQWWLDFWKLSSRRKGTCGTALEKGERIIVEDVTQSPIFIGTPALDIQLKAGVRAVCSTPLINRAGIIVGMISIHFSKPYRPDNHTLHMIDLLAPQAADLIEHTRDIRHSEERFRALVVTSSNIIYRMNPDWSEMKQLRGIHFLEDDDIADNNWLQKYIPHQEQPRIIAAINEAIAARQLLKLEHRVFMSDGSIGWAFSQAVPLIDEQGNIYEWFGTSSDISERKRAQETLQKNEALLRAVTDNNQDSIYLKDHDCRFLFANPATLQIIGKPAEATIGRTNNELFNTPADALILTENDLKIMQSGQAEVIEETLTNPDGTRRFFLSNKAPWYDENGVVIGLVGVSHEITERKEAELALKRRTEELDAANKELESFSYSVSHDLRSQLNNMKCLSQVLLEKCDISGEAEDFIRRISGSIDKMALIISGMLSLAKLTRESMICHTIDLIPIVKSIFYELRQNDPDRDVEICIHPELTAYADARLMHIALSNLVENAWKYSSHKPKARIEIGIAGIANEEVFFIRDNGAGFNMKHASRLFKPFQRLHSENQFPGTGIGLAIVSKIIHRHNGKIWAESVIGEGTTFYFTLALQHHENDAAVKELMQTPSDFFSSCNKS